MFLSERGYGSNSGSSAALVTLLRTAVYHAFAYAFIVVRLSVRVDFGY